MKQRAHIPSHVPEVEGGLRSRYIRLPESIRECSGIVVLNRRIRSLIFSTDVAIIRNTNADAVLAVYPFTPQPFITHALILAADVPVFCGVGGGLTSGRRTLEIALDAEFQGALGVVANCPIPDRLIKQLKAQLEIPVIATIVSAGEVPGRLDAGVDIFNVSGAKRTPEIVEKIRAHDPTIPIIATGGNKDETIRQTIAAGANAITYTPPTSRELYKKVMDRHRRESGASSDP